MTEKASPHLRKRRCDKSQAHYACSHESREPETDALRKNSCQSRLNEDSNRGALITGEKAYMPTKGCPVAWMEPTQARSELEMGPRT